jgi:hypothetical protein
MISAHLTFCRDFLLGLVAGHPAEARAVGCIADLYAEIERRDAITDLGLAQSIAALHAEAPAFEAEQADTFDELCRVLEAEAVPAIVRQIECLPSEVAPGRRYLRITLEPNGNVYHREWRRTVPDVGS